MNRRMMRAARANGRSLVKLGWSPWEDVSAELAAIRKRAGASADSLIGAWKNNLFVVQLDRKATACGEARQLMIRRNDEGTQVSWAEKQRIKNELLGLEAVAIEVFPAASEMHDVANIYHLWCLPEGFSLPFTLK